jgi:hypothetical protein
MEYDYSLRLRALATKKSLSAKTENENIYELNSILACSDLLVLLPLSSLQLAGPCGTSHSTWYSLPDLA